VLSTLDGKALAEGDVTQFARGDRVTSHTVLRFKDGSVNEETVVFSQRRTFRLISDHQVQKGPAFKQPMDVSVDGLTGQVIVRYTDNDGKEKTVTDRLKLPANVSNGMILTLLKNIRPDVPLTTLSMVAAAPKPRLVKLLISPEGEDSVSAGGLSHKATRYVVKVDNLGDKLAALVFQFGYFNKAAFKTQADFIAVLEPFLKSLPKGYPFVLEIRNKGWMDDGFMDTLRKYKVAFALIDQSWVPRPWEFKTPLDTHTADIAYIRLLGDRKGIEQVTKTWDKIVVDKTADLKKWAGEVESLQKLKIPVMIAVNNHFQGCGPETVRAFQKLLKLN
jgi:hypothetical protein